MEHQLNIGEGRVECDRRVLEQQLIVTDKPNEQARLALVRQLSAYNQSKAGQSDSRLLSVLIQAQEGNLLGGLWGSTGYGWFCTHLLIVPQTMRNCGLGSKIMHCAETEAIARGCHSAWLETYEFQSRRFYERLGYECFAELKDYPLGFSRFFMKKRLVAG